MRRLRKWFHRWILDSMITNPPPIIIVLLCVFGSVFSIGFWFAHWIDELTLTNYRIYDIMSDNIGGYPVLNVMGNLLPIDVVYTWVNGSDPYVVENLKRVTNLEKSRCIARNCFPSSYFVAEILEEKHAKLFSNAQGFQQTVLARKGNRSKQFAILCTSKEVNPEEFVSNLKSHINDSVIVHQAFWTSAYENNSIWCELNAKFTDITVEWSVAWQKGLIIRIDPSSELHLEISNASPENYPNFVKHCTVADFLHTFVVECTEEFLIKKLIEDIKNYSSRGKLKFPRVWKANLVLDPNFAKKELDINRFEDNEELRYSLRSIEKYAPWVRRVFLVTNGQIPHWLNLDHPRISIVTHDQIFPDVSHLPTFSSPAIESHIHRIPGLSQHFLYLNDDVMLGDFVWPDDFYIPSSGYKVYLAWSLPECSSGCPGTWINDGYCDRACNTSACGYDGGDCLGSKDQLERDGSYYVVGDDDPFNMESEFCFTSCSDSWLADSYCDAACSFPSCGFDAGDCGLEIIKENLLQLPFDIRSEENITITIPKGTLSAWMDIKLLLEMEKNSSFKGSYSSTRGVRIATANVPLGALIFVFRSNASGVTYVEFGFFDREKEVYSRKAHFYIKFNTYPVNLTTDAKDFNPASVIQAEEVINFSFRERAPKISNSTYSFGKEELLLLNHSNSVLTKEVINEVKALHNKYVNGELTEKGFKLKKLSLINRGHHLVSQRSKGEADEKPLLFSYLHPNRSSQFSANRKLLGFEPRLGSAQEDGAVGSYTGQFPWEQNRNSILDLMELDISADKKIKMGRRLLDSFGESLLYVNQLYNSEFGFEARRVPAHMPHFINKKILQELQDRFSYEFYLTSSHKVRQGNDMQFAFSYFYYLMSEKKQKTIQEIFDMFDTDLSGTWADREIRTFLTKTTDLPLHYQSFAEIHSEMKNCSKKFDVKPVPTPPFERYADSDVPTITKELIEKCTGSALRSKIKKLENVPKFHFSVVSDSAVHFKMIKSNISSVVYHLDDVRKNTRKFICINQDLDPRSSDNDLVLALLQDTYEALYPIPSAFELPPNYRNRFTYMWQLEEWRRWKNFIRSLIYAFLSCFLLLTLTSFFSHEIESMKRRWCKRRRRKDDKSIARV